MLRYKQYKIGYIWKCKIKLFTLEKTAEDD